MHKDTFKGSLLGCFEYVPYTVLTIVKTINVILITKRIKYLILMKGFFLIENQDNKLLGLFVFLKIKNVCKDDVFLVFKAISVNVFVPGCTGRLCQMGLIVVTIRLFSLVLRQPILIGWDSNVAFNKLLHDQNNFLIIWLPGEQICLM